jgi:ABC-type polysaccharide/polyol phosphate transport system ATPase subunit
MDADATGWYNIMHQGRHMGLTDQEILARRGEIVEFSELAEYIHVPMKAYSSGMQLRLAFSIATAFAPEVLVMDEWMSAGDAQFQAKAAERLSDLIGQSGIFVFASHSAQLLKENCNLGLVLDQGRAAFFGPIDEALAMQGLG